MQKQNPTPVPQDKFRGQEVEAIRSHPLEFYRMVVAFLKIKDELVYREKQIRNNFSGKKELIKKMKNLSSESRVDMDKKLGSSGK